MGGSKKIKQFDAPIIYKKNCQIFGKKLMKKVAIIGAGISGLYIANLFKKNPNYQITIYEKNTSINLDEGYGLQLSVNSIKLLNEIGFEKLHNHEKFTPEKINFYSNKSLDKICELDITEFNSEDCKYTTLKRSSLINFLKKDLEGLIKTGYNISKINLEKEERRWKRAEGRAKKATLKPVQTNFKPS